MKVLIENAVPLNNGDAALIFAIGEKFKNEGFQVFYSAFNSELVKKKYPNENWVKSEIDSKIVRIPFLGYIVLFIKVLFSKQYRDYDAIVSAPGGYVNSYYGFKRKFQLLSLYKILLNKKIYMYSQSIGPLNAYDKKLIKKYVKYFDLFFVRDDISKERMDELALSEKIIQTKDAAFLLNFMPVIKEKNKRVAISVREWKYDNRSEKIYVNLIHRIVKYFYGLDYQITFLSTCQGEPDYANDALMAQKIYDELPYNIKDNVSVDNQNYNLIELREKLTQFNFVIGTRLHMCILSWLSGTPAFNISYEEKGKECYRYLNIEKYSVDYNYEGQIDNYLFDFINENNYSSIFERINDVNIESNEYFNKLVKNIMNKL